MKRILHVVNIYFVLPYFFGDQFLYFHEKGDRIYVICSPSEFLEPYARQKGFEYKAINIFRSINILKDIQAIISTIRYIRKNKMDIVVGHTPKGALIAMISAWLCGVEQRVYFRHGLVFQTLTGVKRRLMVFLDRLTAAVSTQVICVSPSVYEESLKYKLNIQSKQLVIGGGTCTGIDVYGKFYPYSIDKEKKVLLRQQLHISENDFVIGFCGRLVKDKGIVELIEAFEILRKNTELRVVLLLVGMFEVRDALPENIQNYIHDDPQIIYTGFINEDIEYYYSLMDIYVLPSYREGFPTSVLEASSMKLPVIVSNATGCVDAVKNEVTGLVVPITPDKIFQSIEYYLNNPQKIVEHGKNGREFVVSNFDQKIIWNFLYKFYHSEK